MSILKPTLDLVQVLASLTPEAAEVVRRAIKDAKCAKKEAYGPVATANALVATIKASLASANEAFDTFRGSGPPDERGRPTWVTPKDNAHKWDVLHGERTRLNIALKDARRAAQSALATYRATQRAEDTQSDAAHDTTEHPSEKVT